MKKLLALLLLTCISGAQACPTVPSPPTGTWQAAAPFVKNPMLVCTWQNASSVPREFLGDAAFVNSRTGVGYPPNVWNDIDVSAQSGGVVPRTAVAALVSGILTITSSTTAPSVYIVDMEVTWKAPSDTVTDPACNFGGQVVTSFNNEGMRSPFTTVIPLENGHAQVYWNPTPPGANYNGMNRAPYFGVNATVQMVCMP